MKLRGEITKVRVTLVAAIEASARKWPAKVAYYAEASRQHWRAIVVWGAYVSAMTVVLMTVVMPLSSSALDTLQTLDTLAGNAAHEALRSVGLTVGGLAVLVGAAINLPLAVLRTNASQQQAVTAAQSHITERFSKAVEQLGSDRIATRLGAIYALARIAQDSVERDHWPIMETLTAFIRAGVDEMNIESRETANSMEEVATEAGREVSDVRGIRESLRTLPSDVQAAFDVIGGRSDAQWAFERRRRLRIGLADVSLPRVLLESAYLSWANLDGANLSGASLFRTHLVYAHLVRANLSGAGLLRTRLYGANLEAANLAHASLIGADFSNANLHRADLSNTNLDGATLNGADLVGANLGGAKVSENTRWDERTQWPDGFNPETDFATHPNDTLNSLAEDLATSEPRDAP